MSTEGHAFAVGQLRSFIERVERVEEEIKNLNDDKSDIYKEIRSAGFDVKTVRKIVAKRKLADDVRNEQDTLFDTYWEALTGSSLVHVHARENIEQFDPMTGEFLDDNVDPKLAHTIATGLQTETGRAALVAAVDILIEREEAEERRSDAGLDIVTKHTEIATNEGGATETILEAGQGAGNSHLIEPSGPEAERATSFTAKPPSPLRPHCRQPEACGGYGRNHCHTCAKAMREREPAEELA